MHPFAASSPSGTASDQASLPSDFLNCVINGLSDPIFVKDRQHRWVMLNDAFCTFIGQERKTLLGQSDHDVFPTEQAKIFWEQDEQVFITGNANEWEQSFTDQNGTTRILSIKKSLIKDAHEEEFLVGIIQDITLRKQTEEELRQSEANQRVLLSALPDLILRMTGDGFYLDFVPTETFHIFGSADLVGTSIHGSLPPHLVERRLAYMQKALETGKLQVYEQDIQVNGEIRTEEIRITVSGDNEVLIIVRDMTDRKRAELALEHLKNELEARVEERTQALQKSEARLRALVENLPFGCWSSDTTSRHIMQNAISIKQWGNLIGKCPQDLNLPPEILSQWLTNNAKVLAGEVLHLENEYFQDGEPRIYRTILAPIQAEDGIDGLLGVDIDITELKKNEMALRQNEERLRLVLQNMPVMMNALDADGNIIVWNNEAERVTGYSATEIINNPQVMELLYPDTKYRERLVGKWTKPGSNYRNWEGKIWCRDGNVKTILWSNISAQFPISGWATWSVGIDISDRKQAETHLRASEAQLRQQTDELTHALQELRRTQSQLVQSEKMSSLGQLVAGVAHEINNPVSFIYGNLNYADEYIQTLLKLLQLYQTHYPNPVAEIRTQTEVLDLEFVVSDLPKLLSSMRVGAERIQQIVVSLRTFSRMDEAEMKAVNIHTGIDSTLMILQSRFKAQPQRLAIAVVTNYGDLPLVECYAGQLNQVFMNILANAIDALEEAAIKNHKSKWQPTITICTEYIPQDHLLASRSSVPSPFIRIRIADNGPGIPASVKQRLFDPFFTTKPIGKGTGMGLSISYQIVTERHGGVLECISEPGQGAEFRIEIPISQDMVHRREVKESRGAG